MDGPFGKRLTQNISTCKCSLPSAYIKCQMHEADARGRKVGDRANTSAVHDVQPELATSGFTRDSSAGDYLRPGIGWRACFGPPPAFRLFRSIQKLSSGVRLFTEARFARPAPRAQLAEDPSTKRGEACFRRKRRPRSRKFSFGQ